MIDIARDKRRAAFSVWLRTGRRPTVRSDGIELKFNPYHDPRNGQFTFAPAGPRSLGNSIGSPRHSSARLAQPGQSDEAVAGAKSDAIAFSNEHITARAQDAVYRAGDTSAALQPAQMYRSPRSPRGGRGGNSGEVPYDPVVLAQVAPGLLTAPGGSIIAIVDNLLDLHGPQLEATAAFTFNHSRILIDQIKAIDPSYRFESLGFPRTLQGQLNQLDDLRFERAAALMRVKGELRPLQVETLRFIQAQADRAYDVALAQLRAGKLRIRLSSQEAIGNFIDGSVRRELRRRYGWYKVEAAGPGPVRVNRRENDTSSSDATFRRPDARVGDVAYDVTLTRKTLATPQVRGFFNTDFKPSNVVIIRPSQLGAGSSYVIKRPETVR